MIHGPCGSANPHAPCMVNGKCSKHYPKKFCDETTIDHNGFVCYRRRNDPTNTVLKDGFVVDNRWIVPYNRDLLVLFDAHINVECVAKHKMVKYLYKYVNKGHDRATIVIEDNVSSDSDSRRIRYRHVDEIKQYLNVRYVSSIEACWRICGFELQSQYPSVLRLAYHLPNEQIVTFRDDDNMFSVRDRPDIEKTMLTEWFRTNRDDTSARSLTYIEFPTLWVWKKQEKIWKSRESHQCIGRLPFAHPNSGEKYYLRMLLHKVKGAKSFEDIRTVNGTLHPTFRSTCVALGLLDDDNEWHEALTEASTWASPPNLRNMFCTMLMFSDITNPLHLWRQHWESLTDDFLHRIRRESGHGGVQLSDDVLMNMGLVEIERILNQNGRSLKEWPQMPIPDAESTHFWSNRLIREELDYDSTSELSLFNSLYSGLNVDQLRVYDAVYHAYSSKQGGMFFVYGSGGTGKTYLWRTLIAKFRSENQIVLSVASSGIASLLLPGGRTAHSRFKIPIDPDDSSCCSISQRSELATLIQNAALIIWDEAPMIHKFSFEAVDRTFRDILKNTEFCSVDRPFGGKLFVLGGDFRQTLPVVPKGSRASTVAASIQMSSLWDNCRVMRLTINMRIMGHDRTYALNHELHNFAKWVLEVGDGKVPTRTFNDCTEAQWIKIPSEFLIKNDSCALQSFIKAVYPDLASRYKDVTYLRERGILAPKNSDVDELNAMMLTMIPGEVHTFLSADSYASHEGDSNDAELNPPELLHSLNISGLPNHSLELKIGTPVMLLRNLNQTLGLCNGTRLIVERIGKKVIEAQIITGTNAGDTVLIPRIVLTPSSSHAPIPIRRRQFPLKVAFAMTINKSQGQTLKSAGVYLPNPVFSHGQLYVAVSRVTTPTGLKILVDNKEGLPHNYTQNVVYREVLDITNN